MSHGIFMRRYYNFLGCAWFCGGYTVFGSQTIYQKSLRQYDYSDDHLKTVGPELNASVASGTVIADYTGRIFIFNGLRIDGYGGCYYYDSV